MLLAVVFAETVKDSVDRELDRTHEANVRIWVSSPCGRDFFPGQIQGSAGQKMRKMSRKGK